MFARLRWLWELAITFVRDATTATTSAWNRFWFSLADPTTLCVIRVLAGSMLFYTHVVWTLDLENFFGEHSWLSADVIAQATPDGFSWSVLSWCHSPAMLWTMHIVALTTFVFLTIGLWTRAAAVLAFVFTVSYANRTPGALYGLDQVNSLLSLYLMVGPCGSRFSVDAWRAKRAGRLIDAPSVTANLAIRLMQCHLCVIYLFAGLSKLQGLTWWNGFAFWGGIANQEYQTLDLTWLSNWPLVINALTHLTVAFELSYCVLIWNRWTRPFVLLVAVALHLGIVFALGMPTFGLAMLIANGAFISPSFLRMLIDGPTCGAAVSPAPSQHSRPAAPHFRREAKSNSISSR
jgi:uncharacterized membrane protein YphA (DoxX/SURF4 family)